MKNIATVKPKMQIIGKTLSFGDSGTEEKTRQNSKRDRQAQKTGCGTVD